MENKEQLYRIQGLAREIVEMVLQEDFFNRNIEMRDSVEHLANTVAALTKIQLSEDRNSEDTLQYTVSKMRIVRNAVEQQKEKLNMKQLA